MKPWIKRVGLFSLVNLAIMLTLGMVALFSGAPQYLERHYEIDLRVLLAVFTVWGFGASLLTLAFSRIAAKRLLRMAIISPTKAGNLQWLAVMVGDVSRRAGVPCPEVGVYRSEEANAFATGPTQSRGLVAFSTRLLETMDKEAIEGVAAHEVAHIKNGDMVTMTLIQGVVNVFVLILAHLVAYLLSQMVRDRLQRGVWIITHVVAELIFGFAGLMITGIFSRRREFHADAGSAALVGSPRMIKALEFLKEQETAEKEGLPALVSALGIAGESNRFLRLLATHPPLEKRIEALRKLA